MDDHIEADIDRLLERFARELEGVEVSDELFSDRAHTTRTPRPRPGDNDFRMRIFANAPKSDGERIFAERRSW